MTSRAPQPSSRFVRAARSEREDLLRHRGRLSAKREDLLSEVRKLDDAVGNIDGRLEVLSELLGDLMRDPEEPTTEPAPGIDGSSSDSDPAAKTVLQGPAIRETAVKVLLEQPEYIEALHYRQWYDLLRNAGYTVSGKDPLAVFLTQLTRSPVVRKATQAGVYELDRQAPLRLRQRLEKLQAELSGLATTQPVDDIAEARARRHELDVAISQVERALEEALQVLRRGELDERHTSPRVGTA
jgi:hypothetical protein